MDLWTPMNVYCSIVQATMLHVLVFEMVESGNTPILPKISCLPSKDARNRMLESTLWDSDQQDKFWPELEKETFV